MPRAPRYHLPCDRSRKKKRDWLHVGSWWIASFLITLFLASAVVRYRQGQRSAERTGRPKSTATADLQQPKPPPSVFEHLVYPTAADLLSGSTNGPPVFMPTAAGNPQSALFGSTRTGNDGLARFHAGIDIAPQKRDRSGKPLDEVVAIADGRIGYINRIGGNSSYGAYVVVMHDDPVGPVYSLYAHLGEVSRELRSGSKVQAGTPLGILGYSASTGIPQARAHLHLEIGTMLSERFGAWSKARKILPDRGNHHGWNLFAVDALDVYAHHRSREPFSFAEYLSGIAPAFELVLSAPRRLDYFARYPSLWQGPGSPSGILVIRVSEGGVILSGRTASEVEAATHRRTRGTFVQNVDEAVLGRNGFHMIAKVRGNWTLGRAAARWIEVLTY